MITQRLYSISAGKLRNGISTFLLKDVPVRQCSTSSALPLKRTKPRAIGLRETHFVDWKRVQVIGGRGGNGAIAFLHLFCNPLAGPSGGNGGNGGHVILEVDTNEKSLNLSSILRGEDGLKGGPKNLFGANANHTIVKVPVGTVVKDITGKVLADLDVPGIQFVAARGGTGGKGNAFFLSNTNRHPRVAELGADGENHILTLELKIMAHAGLVGFPNAGKSTLLRAISRARPKVAAYPFTTLKPHVGIIHYDDYEQIAVADLPGLVPDAHKNKGLGLAFLKHVERCLCLLYVIDVAQESPLEQLSALKHELEKYQEGLSSRPHAVIVNKIDLPFGQENAAKLQNELDILVIPISAKKGTNVPALLHHLRDMYDKHSKTKFEW